MTELIIYLNRTDKVITYKYYQMLHGFLMRTIGNKLNTHGKEMHTFVYSNIMNGTRTKNGITFNNNPYFKVRFTTDNDDINNDIIRKLFAKYQSKEKIFLDFIIEHIDVIGVDCSGQYFFTNPASPIYFKKFNKEHNLNNQQLIECAKMIESNVKRKANIANIKLDSNMTIDIVQSYTSSYINFKKDMHVSGRIFKLKISANEETKQFILKNGIGNACGCGFGFIESNLTL